LKDKQVTILPLKCANCSADLKAIEDDVVFFCHLCQICWELNEESLIDRKIIVVKKKLKAPYRFYLPFWYINRAVLIPAFLSTEIIKLAKYFTRLNMESTGSMVSHLFGASLYSWECARLISLVNPKLNDSMKMSFEIAAIPFTYVDDKLIELIKGQNFYSQNIDNFQEIYKRSMKGQRRRK